MSLMESDKEITGPINIGNPVEFTILDLAEQVINKVNSKSKIVFMDLPQDDPLQRQPVISKAKMLLGWEPTVELRVGLDKTIPYFNSLVSRK